MEEIYSAGFAKTGFGRTHQNANGHILDSNRLLNRSRSRSRVRLDYDDHNDDDDDDDDRLFEVRLFYSFPYVCPEPVLAK